MFPAASSDAYENAMCHMKCVGLHHFYKPGQNLSEHHFVLIFDLPAASSVSPIGICQQVC